MTGLYTNYIWPPSDEGGGFCEAKDGGRENALMKFFITTPSLLCHAETKGAENRFWLHSQPSGIQPSVFSICFLSLTIIRFSKREM